MGSSKLYRAYDRTSRFGLDLIYLVPNCLLDIPSLQIMLDSCNTLHSTQLPLEPGHVQQIAIPQCNHADAALVAQDVSLQALRPVAI